MTARHDRIRNLGAAGALAIVAVLLTMVALPHHQSRAEAAAPRTAVALVATRDLPIGTALSAAVASRALVARPVPAAALAPDAVTSVADVGSKVVVQPVYAGEQLTARRVGDSAAAGLRSVLGGDERVIQISGQPTQLLAGTLRDGDHVDVVASLKRGQAQTPYAGVVLRNLVVLDAPAAPSTSSSGATQVVAATVELTDRQVQQLFYVLQNGSWSFVLRPAAHVAVTTGGPVSAESVLEGR